MKFTTIDRAVRLGLLVATVAFVSCLVGREVSERNVDLLTTAARLPLVIVSGQTEQLPTADYLSSVGGISTNASVPSAAGDVMTSTAHVNTSGQSVAFSTYYNATAGTALSAGRNVWIGGGGLSSTAAGGDTSLGARNTSLGPDALLNVTTGYRNIAIGDLALTTTTTGADQIAIGASALQSSTTATDMIAIGAYALNLNTTGTSNIAMNGSALRSNTTGTGNVAIGASSLRFNISGGSNIAVGLNALNVNTASNNIGIGVGSLILNTTGTSNVAIGGASTLAANITHDNSIGIGNSALLHCDADDNIGIGTSAGQSISSGADNIFLGKTSGNATTTGHDNIGLGFNSLVLNVSGFENLALGTLALHASTGNYNMGLGVIAGYEVTSGTRNTIVGVETGRGITTGSNNTIVGAWVAGLAAATEKKIILADGTGTAADQIWLSPTAPTSVSHGSLGTGSTNTVGNVTGVGAFTTVVLTFSNSGFPNRSWCRASPETGSQIINITRSATAPTFSCIDSLTQAAANCVDFTYWCSGQ